MKSIREETEIPSYFLAPWAVTAVPAVPQPNQWVTGTVCTSKIKKKEGDELEGFCCLYNKT